ncbi:MAG: DoxX family protein [Leptolyngbya sp. SIO1D8]|nr:DoxX family protein [Leptolyngbya sp. SIO1D8]
MAIQKYIPLTARTFLAVIFIYTGIAKIGGFSGTQQQIASAGIPLAALVTVFTIVFEITGGVSILAGYKARMGALLLLVFLTPATLVFHNPIGDPSQMIQFMKNLAIIGGLLMLLAYGSGPISLERQVPSAGTAQYSKETAPYSES